MADADRYRLMNPEEDGLKYHALEIYYEQPITPNFFLRALVFFAISHTAAAALSVVKELVASVPVFVLTGPPTGAFILLFVMVPLHLSARLVGAPSHAPTTLVMLGYIQSVAMLLVATGIMVRWAGLVLANPDISSELRPLVYSNLPIEARATRILGVFERAMGGPFLASFAVANLIGLYAAGWLLVAITAFRDMWRISWARALAALILTAGMIVIAGAFVVFAGTL